MENFHKFGWINITFKSFIRTLIFPTESDPVSWFFFFFLTKTSGQAVIMPQVNVNKACSVFHHQILQNLENTELLGGKQQKKNLSCEICICHSWVKLAIATPAHIWKDRQFLFLEYSSFQNSQNCFRQDF